MKTITTLILLALASVAVAQTTVPPITPEQLTAGQGFARYRERVAFLSALFGSGRVPAGCTLELADPALNYDRRNFALYCPQPLTACDVPGVSCD